jgi:outer membrane protein OmpA-like peptidoglycan-associated protein
LDELDVTLHGEAPTPEIRERARAAADGVQGARALESRNKITVPGHFEIVRTASGITAKGLVPAEVRETFFSDLQKRGIPIAADQWTSYEFVKGPEWMWRSSFGSWITDFLSTPGARSLSVAGNTVQIKGDATAELQKKWSEGLNLMLPRNVAVKDDLKIFPSVYHIPGYRYASKIDSAAYQKLAAVLAASDVHFDVGSSVLTDTELPKVQAMALAIKNAGPGISYALGGHTDATGDLINNIQLSRDRAKAVATRLTELGVPSDALEIVAFAASQAVGSNETELSRQLSRRVEVIVK